MPLATFKVSISDHLFVQPFPSSVRTPFTFLHLLPNTVNLVEPGGGSPQLGRCGDWEVRMPALGRPCGECAKEEKQETSHFLSQACFSPRRLVIGVRGTPGQAKGTGPF